MLAFMTFPKPFRKPKIAKRWVDCTYVHEKIYAYHASHFINDLGMKLLPSRRAVSASSKKPEF